jgi:hypothetical protein
MSSLPIGFYGFMSTLVVCGTVFYCDNQSAKLEHQWNHVIDKLTNKLNENLKVVHEEVDKNHKETMHMLNQINK